MASVGDRVIQLNGDGIAKRVGKRAAFKKMTPRQQKRYGGIDGDAECENRKNAVLKNQEKNRARLQEIRRRGLWDSKTRPSFTDNTWDTKLSSVDTKMREGNVTLYECEDGTYCPRKTDRVGKEPYVTLDHKMNWKEYILTKGKAEDDGEITKESAKKAYNNTKNLVVMSNVRNSQKNGPRGIFD